MISIGIDIGTSTTQLVLSKLYVDNLASSFSIPRIEIIDKQVLYKSEIIFTPVGETNLIDGQAIKEFLEIELEKAGIYKDDIHTGAVIITGETARKENANEVLQSLSGYAGDFVVATAGPDLESIIAGKGAGVHLYSKKHGTSVVNLDIGGGTTNLVVFSLGEVSDTACLDVGGRLIKFDPTTRKITYIAPKIKELILEKNLAIKIGDIATVEHLQPIVDEMVKLLEESLGVREQTAFFSKIITHKGLKEVNQIKAISFTGGVADSIYDTSEKDIFQYGDIGILLGQRIAHSSLLKKFQLFKPEETIRATVVGAGTHTTEISGSTITYTEEIFPLKNIPILKLSREEESSDPDKFSELLQEKINWFRADKELQHIAIAFHGKAHPSFSEIQMYAEGLLNGMKELIEENYPLIIIVEQDMAKVLGHALFVRLRQKRNLVCIDSIRVENGDYIDIGKPIAEGRVLPVIIKTLVFH